MVSVSARSVASVWVVSSFRSPKWRPTPRAIKQSAQIKSQSPVFLCDLCSCMGVVFGMWPQSYEIFYNFAKNLSLKNV